MDGECSSSDCGPSQPGPSLQQTKLITVSVSSEGEGDKRHGAEEVFESSPLIKVQEGRSRGRRGRRCPGGLNDLNWKNLIATVCMWFTYLFVSAAYSIIGPFFPSEVFTQVNHLY